MKIFAPAAIAEMKSGAVVTGAVMVATVPDPVLVWGGFGQLTIGDLVFQGLGNYGLAQVSSGSLGGAAQEVSLELSGVDPEVLALKEQTVVRDVPVVIWRCIFDRLGHSLLDAKVFTRGRLDQLPSEETIGGDAMLRAIIEGAAKGLGRFRARMRSDADQKLNAPSDDGFKAVSYAGQKTLYWGGTIPSTATTVGNGGVAGGGYFENNQFI